MGRAETYLIPARFAITTGHLLAVLVMYYHIDENVAAGLPENPSTSATNNARSTLMTAWTVAVTCFFFDYLGLFGGLSIFFRSVNLSQSVFHFLGAIYTSWFILNSWNYEMYWKIAGLFSIVPALVELGILLNIFVFRAIPY